MHRVELKVKSLTIPYPSSVVPNAPCGVERLYIEASLHRQAGFLMHRVELKVAFKYACAVSVHGS